MTRLVILCLAWMVLSAATAYYADIWGRRLGKQRKTIFGLRPKYTAVVIITCSGAAIALLSFLVLLTADAGIRRALLNWDQTVAEKRALQVELNRTAGILKAEVDARQQRLEEKKALIASAAGRVRDAKRQVAVTQKELARIQQVSKQTSANLAQKSAELTKTNSQLALAKHNLAESENQFRLMNRQTARINRDSTAFLIEQIRRDTAARKSTLYGAVAAHSGDELARAVVPHGLTVPQAREALRRMMNDAGHLVQMRSKDTSFGGKAFLAVRDKMVLQRVNGQMTRVRVNGQKSMEFAAAQLGDPNTPPGGTVVRLVAMANTMGGDTVPVDFELFENHVVFEKGQEIVSFVIRSSDGKPAVMNHLTGALTDVRTVALKDGLMPMADNSVGSLPPYQLPDVYSEVQRAFREGQQTVRVRALAAGETWTSDDLKLRFEVKRYTEGS